MITPGEILQTPVSPSEKELLINNYSFSAGKFGRSDQKNNQGGGILLEPMKKGTTIHLLGVLYRVKYQSDWRACQLDKRKGQQQT